MTDREKVAVTEWAKDHWSTFAYAETCCVDYKGLLNYERLRKDGDQYPTRLAEGLVIEGHDDLDCIRDLVSGGLLEFDESQGLLHLKCKMTDLGREVIAQLRGEKEMGVSFAQFEPREDLLFRILDNQGLKAYLVTVVRRESRYQRIRVAGATEGCARALAEEWLEEDNFAHCDEEVEIEAINAVDWEP